jgi:hypothetical protein
MTTRILTHAAALMLLMFALVLVTSGTAAAVLGVGLVLFVVALVGFGPERVGFGFLVLAFGTAPMYKGLAPEGALATPTDLCLVIGFALLFPRLLGNPFGLPARYVLAVLVIFATGVIGSLVSIAPAASLVALTFWIGTMFGLPVAIHLWRPSHLTIQTLVWSFVAGHMVSTFYGIAAGRIGDGRLYGLTNHPNYFAESGVIAFGLLLHLLATSRHKVLVWAALAVTVYTVYASGSRAGTLALAAIVAAIPFVERSAIKAYALALLGAGGAVVLATQWSRLAAGDSSLGRLTGGGSAAGSDIERTRGLTEGWHLFLEHPLTGSGLIAENLFTVHNNYLESAIAIGIFGTIAFLVVLYTLGKPLLSEHPSRRLCYTVVGYAVFGATTPGLYDRTYWVAMSLSIIVVAATWSESRASREGEPDSGGKTPKTHLQPLTPRVR